MVQLEITERGKQSIQRAKERFAKLSKSVSDMTPVWDKFIPFYQDVIVEGAFNTRGKNMLLGWGAYSPAYAKRKGIGAANLKVTETMYNAAKGGSGWFDRKTKDNLSFGIAGEDYFAVHQYGYQPNNIPQRPYLFTANQDLPARAWAFLIKTTDQHIEDSFND